MTNIEIHENVSRVKELMGDTYDDNQIVRALSMHQNDVERALNYLLEGDHAAAEDLAPNHLRQSIADAFTGGGQTSGRSHRPGTEQVDWSEAEWENRDTSTSGPVNMQYDWSLPPPEVHSPGPIQTTQQEQPDHAREPEVLPNSPPKGSYQPVTVTGQTTPIEELLPSDPTFRPYNLRKRTGPPPNYGLATQSPELEPPLPDLLMMDDNTDKRYEAELNAAIQASLASEGPSLPKSPQPQNVMGPRQLKDLTAEDEQMSKALEESLAMSGSRTLEADGKFCHPPAAKRVRTPTNPAALRVQNPHLVFLPCILSAMYAAKPFRDRVLAFQPVSTPELEPLTSHSVEGMWKGRSTWRAGDHWPDKASAVEIILAIQRLFAVMTHTKRSYLDVQEISLLLGYEEGEKISWSLNEPNKGCHRTYEAIAEAWREYLWDVYKQTSTEANNQEVLAKYEHDRRLFHWRGHKLPLPLPQDESPVVAPPTLSDNATTSLTLITMGSTLNDVYSCIDAQVWLPEANSAHFLDGTSCVIAFEIDRKTNSPQSSWGTGPILPGVTGDLRVPFKLEPEFWVDRYLLQKRHKIAELREEISRIEGEADVSLARRDQLSQAAGKDVVSTLRATVDYLSTTTQYPSTTSSDRESRKKDVLPKFQQALSKLEAELASLNQKAQAALVAAKTVFHVPEMKELGPHDLCSVVVSDGFSGREHMWTYIKADDGRWFKSLDQSMTEVSLETVLTDPAGLHMNSGHIFAIYVQRPTSGESVIDSTSVPLPPLLQVS